MAEKWFRTAIAEGFMGLVALRLDGFPAADAVTMTLDVWLVALNKGRQWDQLEDTPRIKEAFQTLFGACERWPSPARFLRELPPRKLPPGLPKPERTDKQVKTGNDALDTIISGLGARTRAQTTSALKTNKQFQEARQQTQLVVDELQHRASQLRNTEHHP